MSVHTFPDCIYKPLVFFITTRRDWREYVEHYGQSGRPYPAQGAAQCSKLTIPGHSPVIIITANMAGLRRGGAAYVAEVCAHEATHVMRHICENVGEDFLGWEAEAHLVGALTKWMWKIIVDGSVN